MELINKSIKYRYTNEAYLKASDIFLAQAKELSRDLSVNNSEEELKLEIHRITGGATMLGFTALVSDLEKLLESPKKAEFIELFIEHLEQTGMQLSS